MTININIIIASVLAATQQAVALKRQATDSLTEKNTDWKSEAAGIFAGIPIDPKLGLVEYLKNSKGYDDESIAVVGTVLSTIVTPELIEALANGGDFTPHYVDAKPDADIVKHIIDNLKLPTPSAATAPAAPAAKASSFINPALKDVLNGILVQASGGKLTDITAILDSQEATTAKLNETIDKLHEVQMIARQPVIPTTGKVTINATELTYELVNVAANTVFPKANGKPTGKGLSFNIPTLIWKDTQGNVVQHPETPDIDPNYDFDGIRLLQFLTGLTRGMNQWLFGHTGTGKTTFVEQVAARMGWPCIRINLDANLERADIVGHVALHEVNGTTVTRFEEGILPYAMQRPGILICDEVDAGRPDILFSLQKALESKGLTLTEDNHRIITPHPLFRFAATANTRGQGDEYGMYAGTRTMNASMIDRFTSFIEFTYMQAARESALLQALVPVLAKDMADKMAQFATEVRNAFSKGEVYNTISPRGLSTLADCYATFTTYGTPDNVAFQMAMEMTILNKVTNDTRQKFIELAQRTFGFKVK